jgi:hypothetical protein
MEESGLPVFITIIAAAVMVIGVMVGMFAVTWLLLLNNA